MDGKELKRRRAKLNMTQQGLADVLGVGWSAVARWEIDDNPVPLWADKFTALLLREARRHRRKKTRGGS